MARDSILSRVQEKSANPPQAFYIARTTFGNAGTLSPPRNCVARIDIADTAAGTTLDRRGIPLRMTPQSKSAAPRAPLNLLGLACAIGVSTIYFNQPLLVEMGKTYGAPAGRGDVRLRRHAGRLRAWTAALCSAGRSAGAPRAHDAHVRRRGCDASSGLPCAHAGLADRGQRRAGEWWPRSPTSWSLSRRTMVPEKARGRATER